MTDQKQLTELLQYIRLIEFQVNLLVEENEKLQDEIKVLKGLK